MGLYTKLADVMGAMKNVPKNGKHPSQGYSFATEGDITEQVRGELASRGVALLVSITGAESSRVAETKNGTPIFRTICTFEFRLIDGETGEVATCTWMNEAMDSSDKGFNKAATAALKYWLIKTFMIPTGLPDAHEMATGVQDRPKRNPYSAPAQSPAQPERPATPKATATSDGELTHDEAFQLVMKHPDVVRTLSNSGERAKRWNAVKSTLPDKVTATTAVNAMLEAA
jgi:hypothetical protein